MFHCRPAARAAGLSFSKNILYIYSVMKFNVLTIFPEIINDYCSRSILGRAQKAGTIKIEATNFRDFTLNKQKHVDDSPYGGGAGMVLSAEPIFRALDAIKESNPTFAKASAVKAKTIILSAKGKQFNQKMAYDWSKKYDQLILISGRYEGIDERVKTALRAEEISIGPFVLTDGDVAAMAIISAVARLIPGVIRPESLREESFNQKFEIRNLPAGQAGPKSETNSKYKNSKSETLKIKNLKLKITAEYPHYTRPEVLEYKGKKYRVPKVLLSGDHKKIAQWRQSKSGKNG
ncbi:MAG: tRNA (guanine-N(1)-)-methyltransferase [Candidatus Magasanikbacteria bacterium GW2011_GWA2_40_10]|uniref:tRNA (guanine-N(1)-)-methyltransferase n=1 Tax=Candidatus Magasanikbacteria bacterium GW2011_GWA2_40_10 TaxID=1619037 RepID=A0A0G0TC16_9BACT|nr:MAG: tRNA (guanine-N(1)-)-methyltransferase [Candidatus Magasanikbacteria bacterium GW2011_GWA2_40_10]